MKIRNVETALKAKANKQVPSAIDALGIFDNLIRPVFPVPMEELAIMFSFEEMEAPTLVEVRVNSPSDDLITKGKFGVMPDPLGYGRKIINIESILLSERGNYTVDIFEVSEDEKLTFMKTEKLFTLDYPPQREFSDEEIEKILADKSLIRTVKTEYKPLKFLNDKDVEAVKLQISLDKNEELEEGYRAFPENDEVEIKGEKFDLTGLRRHFEWMFGREIPKEDGEVKTEETKE